MRGGPEGLGLERASLGTKDSMASWEGLATSLTIKKDGGAPNALELSFEEGLAADGIVPPEREVERMEEEPFTVVK